MNLWFLYFLFFIVNIISNYLCMDVFIFQKMSSLSSLTIILNQNKLTGKNYKDWKRKLFIVLIAKNYKYVLTQPRPPVSAEDAHRNQMRLFEKWQKVNEMAKCYILASIFNILQTKHQNLETATEIMDSLQ